MLFTSKQSCSMMKSFIFFLLISMTVDVFGNRAYPTTKFIKLAFAVSKASYLPFPTRRFIKDGGIVENPSTLLPRKILGVIPLLPKYDPKQDKISCSIRGWSAIGYVNKETEILMFTNVQQKLVVFGFRGTDPLNVVDWWSNFKLLPASLTIDKTTITAHRGFRDRYGYIASWFESEYSRIPSDYTILLTGHSLGAAEATIASMFAAGKLKRQPDAVVTFGSPYPGFLSLKKYYREMVGCDRTIRMTVKGDLIPHVPATVPGYLHVCDEVQVDGRIGISLLRAHILYQGYERGIKYKYSNTSDINFGCDRLL